MKREANPWPAELYSARGDLAAAAAEVNGDARRALALAKTLVSVPRPGEGHTMQLFDTLSALGAADLTAARVAEAHLDALAILHQAGHAPKPDQTWGVFAAEGPAMTLTATQVDGGWRRDGIKPWCSLAGLLTGAQAALTEAASAIDAGEADDAAGSLLAARARGIVARTVEDVIQQTGHALGPAPLALDARHAQRVADLQLYVRQHHAERDDAVLARMLVSRGSAPW